MRNLYNEGFKGSVCNEENYKALQFARAKLATIKETKLWARHEKNNDERHRGFAVADTILDHAKEEIAELEEGLSAGDLDNVWEEIADTINWLEILASCFMHNKTFNADEVGLPCPRCESVNCVCDARPDDC